jgi:hypothetical protein
MPAFVQGRYFDVFAANQLAQAFSPNVRPRINRLQAAILDLREAELYADWENATSAAFGQLRAAMGAEAEDPRMIDLAGELSVKSEMFRRVWARQEVVRPAGGPARLHHPELGDLSLYREKLNLAGAGGQVLVVYHAEPGTPSAAALGRLSACASP